MGSPFASLSVSDPIPVPFDSPHTITVRKLTGRELESVQQSHAIGVVLGRSRTWSESFKRILEKGIVQASEFDAAMKDPLTGFDRFAVCRAGLVGWTYAQPAKAVAASPAKDGAPAIEAYDPFDDLDDEMVEFIATEIMRRTKPRLFLTPDEQDTERKNVSSGSIAP